jgi:hypothetical protein
MAMACKSKDVLRLNEEELFAALVVFGPLNVASRWC